MSFNPQTILCFRSSLYSPTDNPGADTLSILERYYSLVIPGILSAGGFIEGVFRGRIFAYWDIDNENQGDVMAHALSTGLKFVAAYAQDSSLSMTLAMELAGTQRWTLPNENGRLPIVHLGERVLVLEEYIMNQEYYSPNTVLIGGRLKEFAEAAGLTDMKTVKLTFSEFPRKFNDQTLYRVTT